MNEQKTIAFRKARKAMTDQALSREQFIIAKFVNTLQFRPRLWGVDEEDVWKAMEKLASLYEDALTVERSRRELFQRKLEALQLREENANGQ